MIELWATFTVISIFGGVFLIGRGLYHFFPAKNAFIPERDYGDVWSLRGRRLSAEGRKAVMKQGTNMVMLGTAVICVSPIWPVALPIGLILFVLYMRKQVKE